MLAGQTPQLWLKNKIYFGLFVFDIIVVITSKTPLPL
jgi:hypothetical protein